MKRKLLFLSFLLILLFGFCNITYGNNETENHLLTLRKVGVTDDFNTGIFHQTQPNFNEQINETYSSDNSRKVSLKRQNVSPTNPFIGDTYVANKSFLTAYYSHLNQNMPNNSVFVDILEFLCFSHTMTHIGTIRLFQNNMSLMLQK